MTVTSVSRYSGLEGGYRSDRNNRCLFIMIKGNLNNSYCNKTQNMCCGNALHILPCFESFSIALMKSCLVFSLCTQGLPGTDGRQGADGRPGIPGTPGIRGPPGII